MTIRVALVGQAFRFPSTTRSTYWNDLLQHRNLITEVDSSRWSLPAFKHVNKNHPGTSYTFAAGSIGDVSRFDAAFFGLSPREAAIMDPQQRLLLELGWEALEDAGIKPSSVAGSRCGVFIGIASADYSTRMADDLGATDASTATGNTASIAANRLSYVFDLRGPSMAIDTACSSSLVAFHQACQSIRSGESRMALAGGVSLHLHPYGFIVFSKASMLSRRGRCNVFDAAADGYVRSEGGGLFLLKNYDDAIRDGDRILAVVANTAVNTDGKKAGLTIPSHTAQAQLLEETYRGAGIRADQIDYLEAHGTGTAVGDPIETRAIGDALGRLRDASQPLLIGSIKSNLGHMEAASGVAGLVKSVYALRHRLVPATIGIENFNPNIAFDALNLEVVTENTALRATGKLVIGCNSFGFGGANAHVILASAPAATPLHPRNLDLALHRPVVISGRDPAALVAVARNLADFADANPAIEFYDIAYHALFRRELHSHRAVLFSAARATLGDDLRVLAQDTDAVVPARSGVALAAATGPGFIFSGNGSQWAGMGAQLMADPLFADTVDEIDRLFQQYGTFSIAATLRADQGPAQYARTEIAQPALFALQVGVTRMLAAVGVVPVAVAGHSVGEVAAAWCCGALSLADAVTVIYHRSRLQGLTQGQGAMTAVALSGTDLLALLEQMALSTEIEVAGFNSASGATLAGSVDALDKIEAHLAAQRISFKRLDLDYAFHCARMDPIEAGVRTALAAIRPRSGTLPMVSTVTGALIDGTLLDAGYWWQNIRCAVQFEQAVDALVDTYCNLFVEIGPHPVLRSYLNESLKNKAVAGRVIATLLRGDDAPRRVQDCCAQILVAGITPDWSGFFPQPGAFVDLPFYPWQRERYWHPVTSESAGLLYRTPVHPLLGAPLAKHALTWEVQIDVQQQRMLGDHVVGHATVFPGTGFVEMALAAALQWMPDSVVEIESLEIRVPLVLNKDHAKVIRLAIAAQDGSFTISAHELGGAEAPVLHALGRIIAQPDSRLAAQRFIRPTRAADFQAAQHQALTMAAGLHYGPAFRAILQGWIESDSVSAELMVPDDIAAEMAQYLAHPALLDCACQLIIELFRDRHEWSRELTLVPVTIARIGLSARGAVPRFGRVIVRNKAPHSLLADVALFDADGHAVVVLHGVRFKSIRLNGIEADALRFVQIGYVAQPLQATPVAGLAETLDRTLRTALMAPAAARAAQQFATEIDPLLDSLASRYALGALDQLNHVSGDAVTPYLRYLRAIVVDDGLAETGPNGLLAPTADASAVKASDIWDSLLNDYPDYFAMVHAVGRVGMHLPDLLRSARTQEQVLPHEASLTKLLRRVLGAPGQAGILDALQQTLASVRQTLQPGQRLTAIEINHNGPIVADTLGPLFDPADSELLFAASSSDSADAAQRVREQWPALGMLQFSLEETAASAAPPARAQLVMLTLDFFSVRENLSALQFARSQLIEGGVLVLLGHYASRWLDFVFGQERTWWSTLDDDAVLSRQRPLAYWQAELEQQGFDAASLHEMAPGSNAGSYLLVARAGPSQRLTEAVLPPPRSWLLVADQDGPSAVIGAALQAQLQARGDHVEVTTCDAAEGLSNALAAVRANTTQTLAGVVLIAGIDRPTEMRAEAVSVSQGTRCMNAAMLTNLLAGSAPEAVCWIITGFAATDYQLPAAPVISESAIADAALWGFGRTLINESPQGTVRLINLEDPRATAIAAVALAAELHTKDLEDEVVILQNGARMVPRLRIAARPDSRTVTASDEREYGVRLGFRIPGQLSNLRWESYLRQPPREGELVVDVQATGLNFRDVMYVLGMLSDEAVENGFAGSSLGLEFAGVVSDVGAGVTGYAPGDRVVGFGPASFGNRVTTSPNAISQFPAWMSFEAAATIPSAFFTVYYALHHLARLQPGEKILIHGAAGGVGIAAIQLARWCGAEIYATAGSDEKRDFLRLMGVTNLYDSRSLRYADQIMADTDGAGIDVVLNSLAGEAINRNFRILKPFGRFLELGKRDFYENTKVGLRPFRNNISYFGIDADQLMAERPDLTRRLFGEMMALFDQGVLHPLPYQAFEADQVGDAFRYMQQARQIGKVVVTYRHALASAVEPVLAPPKRLALSRQATYLVTGGLSGFGLKTAERLAALGAGHLVLISRSGATTEEAKNGLKRLAEAGVRVLACACDVTDKAALTDLFTQIKRTMPPLRGIVHAAMVIDDGLVRNLQRSQIERVFAPKITGALHLHQLCKQQSNGARLDFFVLFSSATTLFGNPGQASYVAANSWIEALARLRRAAGLPATCIRWGAIDDVGFLARDQQIKDALQGRMGGAALHSSVALDAMEAMLMADRSGDGVLEVHWKALARFLPGAEAPKFSELARSGGGSDQESSDAADIGALLTTMDDPALVTHFSEILRHELGEILRVAPEKIDSTRSIYEMGLDSLMGVELTVALENRFGIKLPVMALTESQTLEKLAQRLLFLLREMRQPDSSNEVEQQVRQIVALHGSGAHPDSVAELVVELQTGAPEHRSQLIH